MIQQTPRLNQPNFYWNSLAKGAGLRDKTLGFLTGNLLQETPPRGMPRRNGAICHEVLMPWNACPKAPQTLQHASKWIHPRSSKSHVPFYTWCIGFLILVPKKTPYPSQHFWLGCWKDNFYINSGVLAVTKLTLLTCWTLGTWKWWIFLQKKTNPPFFEQPEMYQTL